MLFLVLLIACQSKGGSAWAIKRALFGLDGVIWTHDLLNPNQTFCQTELHPDNHGRGCGIQTHERHYQCLCQFSRLVYSITLPTLQISWLRRLDLNQRMQESKSCVLTNFTTPHYYKRWNTILKYIHQIIWITERTLWRQEPNILNKAFRTRPSPCQLLFTTYSLNGDNESEQWGATPRLFAAADMV